MAQILADTASIAPAAITGLVLAGGRGSRMGGVDKGLQPYRGVPLAQHALARLAAQVGPVALNANRHLDEYAAMGVPVWPDPLPGLPGPLAGMLAGLERCTTPYLACVPCDSPLFPLDLVARLGAALAAQDAEIAMAVTPIDGEPVPQPVFCLMRAALTASLRETLEQGERKVGRWAARHRVARVVFDDVGAFANANTLQELQALQR